MLAEHGVAQQCARQEEKKEQEGSQKGSEMKGSHPENGVNRNKKRKKNLAGCREGEQAVCEITTKSTILPAVRTVARQTKSITGHKLGVM